MTTILFQGDSVTDCSRDRRDPQGLGVGYPLYVSQALPGVRVLNRGISGNRAKDLAARWRRDCLKLRPDIVSILIGINDVWRRYDSNDPTGDEAFEASYRKLLEPLQARGVKLLLIQPFLLDVSEGVTAMREDLAGKQAVVRRLAGGYGAALLDADALFRGAVEAQGLPPAHYAGDGVHPTEAGHRLLAGAVAEMLANLL
jgi:lysophospholipase L1-like esterase